MIVRPAKCAACDKGVYPLERVQACGKDYHKGCFKCKHCNMVLSLKAFATINNEPYCKPHYMELFKLKGNYAGFGDENAKGGTGYTGGFFVAISPSTQASTPKKDSSPSSPNPERKASPSPKPEKESQPAPSISVSAPTPTSSLSSSLPTPTITTTSAEETTPTAAIPSHVTTSTAPDSPGTKLRKYQEQTGSAEIRKQSQERVEKVTKAVEESKQNKLPVSTSSIPGFGSGGSKSMIVRPAKCAACDKGVYPLERIQACGKDYHKGCFKCKHCGMVLSLKAFATINNEPYCKPHYMELFKAKGNYAGFGDENAKGGTGYTGAAFAGVTAVSRGALPNPPKKESPANSPSPSHAEAKHEEKPKENEEANNQAEAAKAQEEEARKKHEQEEAEKAAAAKAEEERKKAEQAAAAAAAQAEEAKRKAAQEEEARRKAAAEKEQTEAEKAAAAAAAQAEEAKRKAAEAEAQRKQAEDEAKRAREQEEARKKLAQEEAEKAAAAKAEEERKKAEQAAAAAKAEEAKKQAAEEAKRPAEPQPSSSTPAAATPAPSSPSTTAAPSSPTLAVAAAPGFGSGGSKSMIVRPSKCAACGKGVYPLERVQACDKDWHKGCFRCKHCNMVLSLKAFATINNEPYCKPHYMELFKLKGNYAGFGDENAKGGTGYTGGFFVAISPSTQASTPKKESAPSSPHPEHTTPAPTVSVEVSEPKKEQPTPAPTPAAAASPLKSSNPTTTPASPSALKTSNPTATPSSPTLQPAVPGFGSGGSKSMIVRPAKCAACDKGVYPLERVQACDKDWHKGCFRCKHCNMVLSLKAFATINNEPYCKPHYMELFKLKGNYAGFGDENAKGGTGYTGAAFTGVSKVAQSK
jgi:hypothetical protein